MNVTRRTTLKAIAAGSCGALPLLAHAQDDSSPITIVVGAPTAMDSTARLVADSMRESLKRPAIVVQKFGAGQRLALAEVKRAAPDGRTLVFTTSTVFTLYPHLYTRLDYDGEADFTPIAGIAKFEMAVAVPASGPKDYAQLIESLRRQGDGASFATAPGIGSLPHFIGSAMGIHHGLKMTHVPYNTSVTGLSDLIAGRLPMLITGYPALIELYRAGRIKVLAVTGDARDPRAPEIPTFNEVGFKIRGTTTMGVFGPAKMPPELVNKLYGAVQPMFKSAAIREKLEMQSLSFSPMSPAEMTAAMRIERKVLGDVVKASGYVPQAPN
ncbi:MAG: Bug family tripartite tricarboxylate transporter substrate binding protein [Ramlibacter sp.]